MNIIQINQNFSSAVDMMMGLAVPCLISYSGGLLYESVYQMESGVASNAFTISVIAYYTFQTLASYATGGEKQNPIRHYLSQVIGIGALGTMQIYAYQKLHLIGALGTSLLLSCLLVGSFDYLRKITQLSELHSQR
jgi:hypothetical protein